MCKLVCAALLVVSFAQAQTGQRKAAKMPRVLDDLLLPQPRHITGVVVASDGKPVAEARIDHSNYNGQSHQTDSNGRFELDTRAPILVVRKAGFRGEVLRTQDATEVRVVLQRLSPDLRFPPCSKTEEYVGIVGRGVSFRFRKIQGITASTQGHDADYDARNYYVEAVPGHAGIMHGSGPTWSFGMPLENDVWRSVKYEEKTYDFAGLTIIDARGQLPNGNLWRFLGKLGESASYSDMDEATAKILDKFLDGACLVSDAHP